MRTDAGTNSESRSRSRRRASELSTAGLHRGASATASTSDTSSRVLAGVEPWSEVLSAVQQKALRPCLATSSFLVPGAHFSGRQLFVPPSEARAAAADSLTSGSTGQRPRAQARRQAVRLDSEGSSDSEDEEEWAIAMGLDTSDDDDSDSRTAQARPSTRRRRSEPYEHALGRARAALEAVERTAVSSADAMDWDASSTQGLRPIPSDSEEEQALARERVLARAQTPIEPRSVFSASPTPPPPGSGHDSGAAAVDGPFARPAARTAGPSDGPAQPVASTLSPAATSEARRARIEALLHQHSAHYRDHPSSSATVHPVAANAGPSGTRSRSLSSTLSPGVGGELQRRRSIRIRTSHPFHPFHPSNGSNDDVAADDLETRSPRTVRRVRRRVEERGLDAAAAVAAGTTRAPVARQPETKSSSSNSSWNVRVVIHTYQPLLRSVTGTMHALGVPNASAVNKQSVTTFFQGEIVDFALPPATSSGSTGMGRQGGFWTRKWGATKRDDLDNWSQLGPFASMRFSPLELEEKVLDEEWLGRVCKNWLLMRWKEVEFVNIRAQDSSLSISGFYFIAMNRSTGDTEGLYFDPLSTPYQKLKLSPALPNGQFRLESFELR